MSRAGAAWPLNYLRTHGPAVDAITALQWGLSTISLCVVIVVGGVLLYSCLRPRPPLSHGALAGKEEGGVRWISVGLILTVPLLLGSAVWTLMTLSKVIAAPRAALTIDVRAHQWWWEISYRNDSGAPDFKTANEIHIPVGRPVRIELSSADVIHSFWVPQLAGKADIIPGHSAQVWLQADRAGVYRGQCAEYCGAQHAHMGLLLTAESASQFEAWSEWQRAPGVGPVTPAQQSGRTVLVDACGECHTVRGTAAHGGKAPDLTHVASRSTLAAALLPMSRGNLAGWIADPQALKPSALMPPSALTPEQLQSLLDYVGALR